MFSRFEDKKLRNSRLFLVVFPKIRDREKRMIYTRLESSWIRPTFSRSAGASTAAVKINRRGLRSKRDRCTCACAENNSFAPLANERDRDKTIGIGQRSIRARSFHALWSWPLIARINSSSIDSKNTWHFHVINKSNLLYLIFDVLIHNLY